MTAHQLPFSDEDLPTVIEFLRKNVTAVLADDIIWHLKNCQSAFGRKMFRDQINEDIVENITAGKYPVRTLSRIINTFSWRHTEKEQWWRELHNELLPLITIPDKYKKEKDEGLVTRTLKL